MNELPAREELWLCVGARGIYAGDRRTFWVSVAARARSLEPEIFRFCRSGHVGSGGSFCFLNWWLNLHRSEGGGHDFPKLVVTRGGAWLGIWT